MRNLLGIARISRLPTSPFFSRDLATSSNLNKSHYETLGVHSSASKKEIRDAYIEKSKLCHPDYDPSDATLHVKFVAVQEAYDILSNDAKRKEYDFGLKNFRPNHPRSSAKYPNQYAPGWSQQQQPFGSGDPFGNEKARAFWTDPDYIEKMKRRAEEEKSRKIKFTFMGREFAELDRKNANRLVVGAICFWMFLGILFTYVYTFYIFGRKPAVVMDRQKRISEYQESRDEQYRASRNWEAAIVMRKKPEENTKGE